MRPKRKVMREVLTYLHEQNLNRILLLRCLALWPGRKRYASKELKACYARQEELERMMNEHTR